MRKILLFCFLFICINFSSAQNILISEIADPDDDLSCRFVEIFCHGPGPCDLTGMSLARWTNANASFTPSTLISLSSLGTLQPNEIAVISNNSSSGGTFFTCYGFNANITAGGGGPADSNGDDQIGIINGSNVIIDIFGVPGEDGTGTCHEFEDGRAERKSSVTLSNPTFNEAEWNVWSDNGPAGSCTCHIAQAQDVSDMDPLFSILPVELVKFRFQKIGYTNRLLWTTAAEINNDFFLMERSANGKDFKEIGKIEGNGNSNKTIDYNFIDEDPMFGANYYRLKQVDLDGKYEYSDIIKAENSHSRINIYPTTSSDYITIITDEQQEASVVVFNEIAQIVKDMTISEMTTRIDISNLPNGMYFVQVNAQSGKEIKKIIKQ
jgi:hypothetical protein